jgi:GNAT superfamily N-acetyltransferase
MRRDPVRRAQASRRLKVRPARRGDRAAVSALWASADRLHAQLHPRYFRGDGRLDPRLADGLERANEARELFVAERDGDVIGFVLVELLEPVRASLPGRGRRGHIDTLVVAERARRGGCGRRLIEAAVDWARAHRIDELLLTVWAGNVEAERFYAAIGLQPVSSVLRLTL